MFKEDNPNLQKVQIENTSFAIYHVPPSTVRDLKEQGSSPAEKLTGEEQDFLYPQVRSNMFPDEKFVFEKDNKSYDLIGNGVLKFI